MNSWRALLEKGVDSLQTRGVSATAKKAIVKICRLTTPDFAFKTLCHAEGLELQRQRRFSRSLTISILTPLYNTPLPLLREMIESVQAQTYGSWELCLADGSDSAHREVGRIAARYAQEDSRIRYFSLAENGGISANTNAALERASGQYLALLDHDDILHPAALYNVMEAICEKGAALVYTDEAVFSGKVTRVLGKHFKPDFAPDNLRSNNYFCHFAAFDRRLLEKAGPLRSQFDGSQDHDLMLRLTEQAASPEQIVHIPKLLYWWRSHPGSVAAGIGAKSYAVAAGIRAVESQLQRLSLPGTVESTEGCPTIYRIRYQLSATPLVSILIPHSGCAEELHRCVTSVLEKSSYQNYEILVLTRGSAAEASDQAHPAWRAHPRVRVISCGDGEFHFPTVCGRGAGHANGEQLLLLSSAAEVITPQWIEEMLMFAQREDVGAVGAKLLCPDGRIRSAGVILGLRGSAGPAFCGLPDGETGYVGRSSYAQNFSAVTGACMMVPRRVWDAAGGLDASFAREYSDIDLCLRIRETGKLVVLTPFARLYQFDSACAAICDTPEGRAPLDRDSRHFCNRWQQLLDRGDPYYNPNLTLLRTDFSPR